MSNYEIGLEKLYNMCRYNDLSYVENFISERIGDNTDSKKWYVLSIELKKPFGNIDYPRRKLVSVSYLAEELNVSKHVIYKMEKKGEIINYGSQSGIKRFDVNEILRHRVPNEQHLEERVLEDELVDIES